MSKWSLKTTRKITASMADFIMNRIPTISCINANNLYNAIIKINSVKDHIGPSVCLVQTESGYYIMGKCEEERFRDIYIRLNAMCDHYTEITNKLNSIKQSE
jgi:hypothetical protein